MKFIDRESCDDVTISNMFSDFFASTYSDSAFDDSNDYPVPIVSNQHISIPFIENSETFLNLKKLKSSTQSGPDGLPSCILFNCATTLAEPLTTIFNISISHGYFPKLWKDSYIIPLHKSGSKSDVRNYRGIAKLSQIPKLFEKIITDFICHHVSSLLTSSQHGFRKGCSTMTNLLHFTSIINNGFVQGKLTDAVYTDFSKAFDKVNHSLLLKKLDLMGFTGKSLNWLKSYLTGRHQKVRFKSKTSNSINVSSGVPQGSHIGPVLFTLFINDLPQVVQYCNILMYADDVKILLTYNDFSDYNLLQNDLNNLFSWCKLNLMDLNLEKCKHMRFSRKVFALVPFNLGAHQLEPVNFFNDLGILLDTRLSFVSHINSISNKARGVLAFIKRWGKEFTDPYVLKQLYTSVVRPILEYGSIIWDPQYNVHADKIESIQKQFLLFCLRYLHWNPAVNLPAYTSRLALIKLPTLKSRRTMLNVSFVINLINGDVSSEFLLSNISFNIPQRSTRNYTPLFLKFVRENYADADPFRRVCHDFNQLYTLIDFSLNLNRIKRNVIIFLNN